MNSRIVGQSSVNVPYRTQMIELIMIKKIKICLFLLFVDHFFQLNGINCAESLDFDFISDPIEDFSVEKHSKLSNVMKTFYCDESTIKCQEQKNLEGPDKKFTYTSNYNSFPVTTETDPLPSKIRLLEDRILTADMNLGILQHILIPNLYKVCDEIKGFYIKINEKIKEIKEKSKNYDLELINKIEQKNNVNIKVYNENSVKIDNMRIKTEKLISAFENTLREYQEINVHHHATIDLDSVYKYKDDFASEIYIESNLTLEILKTVQDNFQKDKNQVDSILMLLSKFLEMTPEAFKADEEVKKVISHL